MIKRFAFLTVILVSLSVFLMSFQREPFILKPSAVHEGNYQSLRETLKKFNTISSYYILKDNSRDSIELHLKKTLQLGLDHLSDPDFIGEARLALARYYDLFNETTLSEEQHIKAIDLYIQSGLKTRAVNAATKLTGLYYQREDSTTLKMGPICRQALQWYRELSATDQETLSLQYKALMHYLAIAESYEKYDKGEVHKIKMRKKRAFEYLEKLALYKYQKGNLDSIEYFYKETMKLLGDISQLVDDPEVWRYYLGNRMRFAEFIRNKEEVKGSNVSRDSSITLLYQTLALAEKHMAYYDRSMIPELQCKLYTHLMEKGPTYALGLLESKSNTWGCLIATSKLYHIIGDHEKAIFFDRNRHERSRSAIDRTRSSLDLGKSLLFARSYHEAEYYLRQAKKGLPEIVETTHPNWIVVHSSLASALAGQNKLEEAKRFIIEAEELLHQPGVVVEDRLHRDIYAEHANILANKGSFELSQSFLRKAFDYNRSETNISSINQLKLLGAEILHMAGNHQTALDSLSLLLASLEPKDGTMDNIVFPKDLTRAYKLQGEILVGIFEESKNIYHLKMAHNAYKEACELGNWIRQSYHSETSKLFLQKELVDIFSKKIELGIWLHEFTQEKHYLTEAFSDLENKKSVLLLESIQRPAIKEKVDFPTELINKERESKLALAFLEKEIFRLSEEEPSEDQSGKIRSLQSRMLLYQKSYDSLMLKTAQHFPQYYQLDYQLNTANVEDVQRGLKSSNSALINYSVSSNKLHVFVLTSQDYQVIEIPPIIDLRKKIEQLQKATFSSFLIEDITVQQQQAYNDTLIQNAHLLYQQLIAPILARIDLPEKIIVSPDGPLGYIPFELLLKEIPDDYSSFGSHCYLIKDHQISYTYSATLLQEMQSKSHAAPKSGLLAFAPVFEEADTTSVLEKQSVAVLRGGLKKLYYNIPEVEQINRLLGGAAYIGLDATEDRFLNEAHKYKIIHLSTHGIANEEEGKFSYLAFTAIEDSLENEFLYNQELYDLELNADMVVLSACETGIGQLHEGEGILSLARGFSYAGAKSIITSLWSVNDASSKELMEGFYVYIKEGRDKDEALRLAKLDFIDKHVNEAHPFFWAPFIAIGDMEAIQFKSNMKYLYFGLGVLLISFLYWNGIRKKTVRNPAA